MSPAHPQRLWLGVFAIALVACAAWWLLGTHRGAGADAPPVSLQVAGAPESVYEAILPQLRSRIAHETKIVRVDDARGITARFSVLLEDHSVRMVEIRLRSVPPESAVTIKSGRYSFLPGNPRDTQDVLLERSLAALIIAQTSTGQP